MSAKSMSGSSLAVNLEDRVVSLESELELSAFLNKGILQTNTEYKARINELETENGLLRSAETRLTRTEEKLEDAERKLRQTKRDLEEREKAWRLREKQRGARDEQKSRRVAEIELEGEEWKRKFVKLAKILKAFQGELEVAVKDAEGEGEPTNKVITRARTSGTRRSNVKRARSDSLSMDEDLLPSVPSARKESIIPVTQPSMTSSVRLTSSVKRKRRIVTPETDEILISVYGTPRHDPEMTPSPPPLAAATTIASSSTKRTSAALVNPHSAERHAPAEPLDEKPILKMWKLKNPPIPPLSESDDDLDPLAMSEDDM